MPVFTAFFFQFAQKVGVVIRCHMFDSIIVPFAFDKRIWFGEKFTFRSLEQKISISQPSSSNKKGGGPQFLSSPRIPKIATDYAFQNFCTSFLGR